MKQERLNLYYLDMKYIRDLHHADDRVQSVSPQIHKSNRPFVGIIVVCENHKYCIPLDSAKEKSYFSPTENIIYINDLSIEKFFHELTHLLSYNYLRFQIPNEYYSFKRNFMANPDNTSLIVQFLDLCKRKKTEF